MPREQVHSTPEVAGFIGDPPLPVSGHEPDGRPLAVLFSTNRAIQSKRGPRKGVTAGGIGNGVRGCFLVSASFGSAISAIGWRSKNPRAARIQQPAAKLAACEDAVRRFLPNYADLRLGGEDNPQLLIDRDSTTIPVQQLSDGERGILAIVLDLTRRLAQANPNLTDPASEAEAVVLIDELDLHLHPKWQRQIVHNLTQTFPRCQFIATTHSPQVIGEVPHERIQNHIGRQGLFANPLIWRRFKPSSWKRSMDADPRTTEVKELLSKVSQVIGKEQFDQARRLIEHNSSTGSERMTQK